MLRSSFLRRCAAAASSGAPRDPAMDQAASDSPYRRLTATSLLRVVKQDSGETAQYYAAMYFGPGTERRVTHLLWTDLKKHGHIDLNRGDDLSAPARWFVPSSPPPRRAPKVQRYREQDYDLSVLQHEKVAEDAEDAQVARQLAGQEPIAEPRTVRRPARWQQDLEGLAKHAGSVEAPKVE